MNRPAVASTRQVRLASTVAYVTRWTAPGCAALVVVFAFIALGAAALGQPRDQGAYLRWVAGQAAQMMAMAGALAIAAAAGRRWERTARLVVESEE